jgi:hypothetical protein
MIPKLKTTINILDTSSFCHRARSKKLLALADRMGRLDLLKVDISKLPSMRYDLFDIYYALRVASGYELPQESFLPKLVLAAFPTKNELYPMDGYDNIKHNLLTKKQLRAIQGALNDIASV